ncbi:putative signal recognition particle protein [Talaromyces proteolyticus]|uniref:Signal recognition particle subunit SRP72 n=1 Tax=Talaromyces proteolyticus TaxID=1131652 RepID=A0AAD4Q5F0_9EURO|nr:putative signal recognition particle protein [Talaromyces proteolyticus]KAH8704136.1 putative signal recognition particle protein [Talaromyces proteolyticus]
MAAVQSLSQLLQKSSIEEHENVLKACNAALKKSKTDLQAQHAKVVALLKLDRYEDALRVLEESGDALKGKAPVEYAYALYKCGQLSEAAKVAESQATGRGARHVEAQANYRSENFATAARVYESLAGDEAELGNEYNDLRINTWAVYAQRLWQRQGDMPQIRKPTRDDLEAFETAYNAACASIARGDLKQGEILLKRAKELCKTSEYLSPEEKASELLPITIQQLYTQLRQGNLKNAEELAQEISVSENTELSTKKIAQNNILLSQKQNTNPYKLYKLFHDAPEPRDSDKLFKFQSSAIEANSHALDLDVQKSDGVIRSTTKALAQRPYPSVDPDDSILSIYNAAAQVQGKTTQQAIQELRTLLARRPKDIGLVLIIVQLYVGEGNTTSAINVLESAVRLLEESISEADQEVRFNPGLISVLISLYRQEGRKAHVKAELAKAASYWRQQSKQPTSLLRAAASSLLHSSNPTDLAISQDLFTTIHTKNPGDKFAIAGYVASYATMDLAKVKKELDILPKVSDLVPDVDVTALENAGVPQSQASLAHNAAVLAGARKRAAKDQNARAKKRIRKSRLPKDYDPSKTADAERWLPLRDRSTYRPKGKKGKQRAAERTQGFVVNEKSEDSAAASVGQQQKTAGGGNASKKKKKGKR